MYFSRQKNADDLFLVIYPKIKEITHFSSESANNLKNRLDIWPPRTSIMKPGPEAVYPLTSLWYICAQ